MEEQVSKEHFKRIVNQLMDALLQAQILFDAQIKEQGEDQTNITVMSEIGSEICSRAIQTRLYPSNSICPKCFQPE